MTLRQQFEQTLKSLLGQSNQTIDLTEGSRTLHAAIDQCDQLALACSNLSLETAELAAVDIAKLEKASQSLCRRVNYLLEPISPIETDADGCLVQMRSSPPQKQENGRFYYELLLKRGGSVSLVRYEKQPGSSRVRVAANLTHEVVGRLIDDFEQTIDEVLRS